MDALSEYWQHPAKLLLVLQRLLGSLSPHDRGRRTEYLPCDSVFYRNFIKDCLILLSSFMFSNKRVSWFRLLLGCMGLFYMGSTVVWTLVLGLFKKWPRQTNLRDCEAHGLFPDFTPCFPVLRQEGTLTKFSYLWELPLGLGECLSS